MARRRKTVTAKVANKNVTKTTKKSIGTVEGKVNGVVLRSRVSRNGQGSSKQLVLRNSTIQVIPKKTTQHVHKKFGAVRCVVEPEPPEVMQEPLEAVRESPEVMQESSDVQEPLEVVQESPEEVVQESLEEVVQEPLEVVQESLEEVVQESLEEVVQESLEEVVQESLEEGVQEPPEEVVQEPPEEVVQESLEEVVQEPPEEVVQDSPEEVMQELPHVMQEPPEVLHEQVSWGEGEEVVEETIVCEDMEVANVIEYLEQEQVVVMREEDIEVIHIKDVESQVIVVKNVDFDVSEDEVTVQEHEVLSVNHEGDCREMSALDVSSHRHRPSSNSPLNTHVDQMKSGNIAGDPNCSVQTVEEQSPDCGGHFEDNMTSCDDDIKSVMEDSCEEMVNTKSSNGGSKNNVRAICRENCEVITFQDGCCDRVTTGNINFPNSFREAINVACSRHSSVGENLMAVKTFPEIIHISHLGLDRVEYISSTMHSRVSDDASNDSSVIVRGVELEIESEPACDSQDNINRFQDCEIKGHDTSNTCSDDAGTRDEILQYPSNMKRSEMARVLGIEYDSQGGTVTVGSDIVQIYEEPISKSEVPKQLPVACIERVVNSVSSLKVSENCVQDESVGCDKMGAKDNVPLVKQNIDVVPLGENVYFGGQDTKEDVVIGLDLALKSNPYEAEVVSDENTMTENKIFNEQNISDSNTFETEVKDKKISQKNNNEAILVTKIKDENIREVESNGVSVEGIEDTTFEKKLVCQESKGDCFPDQIGTVVDSQCVIRCANNKIDELFEIGNSSEVQEDKVSCEVQVEEKFVTAEIKSDCEAEMRTEHVIEELDKGSGEFTDRRQHAPAFRSRSGSTDTTSSESSSSCSNGIRRSSRIRSIEVSKQKFSSKGEVSNFLISSVERGSSDDGKISEGKLQSESFLGQATQSETEGISPGVQNISVPMSSPVILPAIPNLEADCLKPVKVKSRWRRSSELEMGGCGGSSRSSDSELAATPPTPSLSPRPSLSAAPLSPMTLATAAEPAGLKELLVDGKSEEMEEKLRQFIPLIENVYLTNRHTSKEAKRMVCDCFLTPDEMARGEMGCGEDCLNSLLMIECGSRCPVGDQCANKRFQKQDYAKCEVFKTEKKGFGLRALQNVPSGTFIMEYVGEVLDPKEFRRRAKEYSKDKNRHYYFMALKSDAIIDATLRGNISRFINHSCDPNAETQKWTVNGELRIGFFSKRQVAAGEEVTFDYQLQRYGKEAQRCYCEAPICRGWIGEDPEKEKQVRKERKEKKKKEEKRRDVREFLDDMDLEEEIEKLCASGLKNRNHTLTLSRLMVRAEDGMSRKQLLKLLQTGEPACRRLFIDYHGLRLIWSWMMSVGHSNQDNGISLKMEILKTLAKLPVPNKTVLQESKVLSVVAKWADNMVHNSSRHGLIRKDRSSVEEESVSSGGTDACSKPRFDLILPTDVELPDEDTVQDIENEKQLVDSTSKEKRLNNLPVKMLEGDDDDVCAENAVVKTEHAEDVCKETSMDESGCDSSEEQGSCLKLASSLLDEWASLKEVFRIPKKERLEQMKEHEREADRGYKEYLDREEEVHNQQSYDRHRKRGDYERPRERTKRSKDSPDSERSRKITRYEDRVIVPLPRISKEEHRQLFAMKVAQKEEEERQRRQQQELWEQHEERCLAVGLDPSITSAFDPNTGYPCFYDPNTNVWQPYPPSQAAQMNMPTQPLQQDPNSLTPPEIRPSPIYKCGNPHMAAPPLLQPVYDPNSPHYPHGHSVPYDGGSHGPYVEVRPALPPVEPLLPEFIPLPTGPHPRPHLLPLPQQPPQQPPQPQPQPPHPLYVPQTFVPAPPVVPVKLPPKWKSAKDSEGRVYYYHVKERVSQWEPPRWPDAMQQLESDSSSETSEDDEDEEEEEEDEEDEEDDEQSSSDDEEEENEQDDKRDEEELEDEEMEDLSEEKLDEETSEYVISTEVLPQIPLPQDSERVLEQTEEKNKEKKREGLVQERIISPRREEDKFDNRNIRELKEKLRRKKEKEQSRSREHDKKKHHRSSKQRSSKSSSEKTIAVAADTSSDSARKIKDQFRLQMAGVIVQYLNPYRKPDCTHGRITNTDDFKHLARKLTHFVMVKELRHCRSVEDLECNENVKHKARDFVKKYMTKFGATYERPKDDN